MVMILFIHHPTTILYWGKLLTTLFYYYYLHLKLNLIFCVDLLHRMIWTNRHWKFPLICEKVRILLSRASQMSRTSILNVKIACSRHSLGISNEILDLRISHWNTQIPKTLVLLWQGLSCSQEDPKTRQNTRF